MASSKNPLWKVTSAEQKAIDLPEKFQCRNCKKFKPPSLFSNKEMNTGYRWKVTNKIRVNGITAKLRCRNCSGDQTQELQCVGPCDLWKGLDDFSKNQRRRSDDAWCMTCTQWKEANEPGVTPFAAPNAILAPDEETMLVDDEAGFASYSVNIEGAADSDDDVPVDTQPVNRGSNRYLYSNPPSSTAGTAGRGEGSTTSKTPSFVEHLPLASFLAAKVARDQSVSTFSNPYDARTEHDGESLDFGTDEPSEEVSRTESQGKLEWAVADRKRRGPTQTYNAWDPSGQVHPQAGTPSSTGATPDGFGTNWDNRWAKKGRGGFATGVGRSNQPTQFPPVTRPIRQNHFDDDEDRDEM